MTHKRLTLQPLTLSNALDLSFFVLREYSRLLFKIILPFLLLNCSFVFVTNFWYDWSAWTIVLSVFLSVLPLGNLLVWTIAKQELIEPYAVADSFRAQNQNKTWKSFVFKGYWQQILMGVASLFLLIPGMWIACKTIFSQERKCFDDAQSDSQTAAWKSILLQQSYNLLGYFIILSCYWVLMTLLLFLAIDLSTTFLLSVSFAIEGFQQGVSLWRLFTDDPYVMTLLTACLLLTFPLVRIAWMFCYISVRVRSDCWDIGTRIKREIHRLQLSRES